MITGTIYFHEVSRLNESVFEIKFIYNHEIDNSSFKDKKKMKYFADYIIRLLIKKNIHEWNMLKEYDNFIYVHRSKIHHIK